MAGNKNKSNDFDADALVSTADEHTRNIQEITERVSKLEKIIQRIENNDNFGNCFSEAAKSSKVLEDAVKGLFTNMLGHDAETRESVKGIVKETDNHTLKVYITSGVRLVGWIISLVIAAVVGAYINAHIH